MEKGKKEKKTTENKERTKNFKFHVSFSLRKKTFEGNGKLPK
jgi:hypothetical protein